ncbi:hypothetical protein B0A50_01976 [Salinomyces thailandicus]|uniref:poly(A)-specific ribonuclease n=1 Tax=Salinomyces thailandicus TaxID=706561 RepID=A0A4U0U7C9_9PEZI|nr:hypothetical protein B0A50_01976 [Salinomyces thailandica]
MPPAVGRMHPSHMSNPFQHLNAQHTIPQSHYQAPNIPNTFGSGQNAAQAFGGGAAQSMLNGGISPFNPSSAYGGTAFSTGAGQTSSFNGNGGFGGGQGQGLASVAAQQGFARGAAMQESNLLQSHQHQLDPTTGHMAAAGLKSNPQTAHPRIREVWRHNLDAEFESLRKLVVKYPYVSMDAEFPGIVARPIGNFAGSKAEYHYQTLRCNVDILKPIQVGITLWTPEGELPPQQADPTLMAELNSRGSKTSSLGMMGLIPCTWVFNFHFDLREDMFAESSIELLRTSGVDFQRHQDHGIDLANFGSLLTTSGLAFSDEVNWLSFHSGYDFGYLIKLLTDDALPVDQGDFFGLVSTFFPKLWDIKFLLRHAQRMRAQGRLSQEGTRVLDGLGTKSGLQDLAEELGCQRIGSAHTGGSDAWLTGSVFWAMKNKIFSGNLDDELADQIYGLHGVAAPASQQYRDEFFAAQGTPQQQANGLSGGISGLQSSAQAFTPGGNPSTPTSSHAGLTNSQTPGAHYGHALGAGSLGQGGFGNFSYNK